jgi:2-polyprenyl-6-methoxyphenol hydroxylase-like FAD-dependent oxidoreductase
MGRRESGHAQCNGCGQESELHVSLLRLSWQVVVHLDGGRTVTGDLLIGADGIWSKIRKQLIGETKVNYSGYTCYTGAVERPGGARDGSSSLPRQHGRWPGVKPSALLCLRRYLGLHSR